MPSTISTSVSSAFASSTVITPSLPTFCIACAIIAPIFLSPFDEMVPTWATSAEEPTFLARFSMSLTTAPTAMSMPRLRSIGFIPAATALAPSRTIACASTVAVVVPSPAWSLVFWATSRTIWAPMFSNLSSSSISLATVTPSLVMRGAPKLLSSTTLRPLGPSVTRTALASVSTPRSMRSRASAANFTSLAAIVGLLRLNSALDPHPEERAKPASRSMRPSWSLSGASSVKRHLAGAPQDDERLIRPSGDHAHDVGLLHDQEFLAVDLDLSAGPLAEQHAVARLEVDRDQLAGLVAPARADRHHLALLGLFLAGVGNDDAAFGLLFGIDTLHDYAVVQWTEPGLGHISLVIGAG